MFTKKTLIGIALTLVMIALPVASVYAAPAAQTVTGGSCTVQKIETSTDSTGALVVTVTCADGTTATFNQADATALGLISLDGSVIGVGKIIQITGEGETDPCAASSDTGTGGTSLTGTSSTGDTGGTSEHPVGAALAGFFCEKLGTTYGTIADYRGQGFGFGVIAQALWMADWLGGDSNTVQQILVAKKSGDYSGIILPDGSPATATNWGQFRKEVFVGVVKKDFGQKNLGQVMSDKGKNSEGTTETQLSNNSSDAQTLSPADVHGKGQGGKDKGRGGHGKGHNKP